MNEDDIQRLVNYILHLEHRIEKLEKTEMV